MNDRAQPLVFCNKDSRSFLFSRAGNIRRTGRPKAIQRILYRGAEIRVETQRSRHEKTRLAVNGLHVCRGIPVADDFVRWYGRFQFGYFCRG